MNPNNMIRDSKGRAKAKAAIPMVAATVTMALLLLGISFVSSNFQPTMAQQQDMNTGGGTSQAGNTTAAGGAGEGGTDSLSQIRMHIDAVRTALQNNDTQGAMLHIELADNALGGAGVLEASNMTAMNTTAGNATAAGNATNMTTAATAAGGNQTTAAGGNQTTAAGGNQTTAAGNATTGGTERGDVLGGIF